ncbi:MAG: RNA polymerase subunit sigma-70, partial [Clostridiales bacterium]|nr:RNA polymerase subunit sigma-70 [Clostridiales bacterium]
LSEEQSPEEFLISSESTKEFKIKLMRELSDFEFRVVTMYLEGMSYAQICEETGKDLKSVDNALSRSKKKLQRAYGA